MTGSANGGLGRSFTAPLRPSVRSGGGGLFGSAFGLLEDMLSIQQPRHDNTREQGYQDRRRVRLEDERDYEDEDLAYDNERSRSRSKGMFSKLRDRLLENKQKPSSRDHNHNHSREQSPVRARPSQAERRRSSYRTEKREPQQRGRPQDRFVEVEIDDDEDEASYPPRPNRRDSRLNLDTIETLENAVEVERRQVRDCKRRLEQATRQPAISSHHLQRLLDELKGHELALVDAQSHLDEAKGKHRRSQAPRPASTNRRSQPPPPQHSRSIDDDLFGVFGTHAFFGQPQARSSHPDPIFQAFQDMHSFDPFPRSPFGNFDSLFEQMHPGANDAHFRFFTDDGQFHHPFADTNQQPKRTRFSTPNGGALPNFSFNAPPPPPPKLPANMLKPAEARHLFKAYNDRWNALPATDANIPYPARNLQAASLSARDTLWAPLCSAPVVTWSEETVMQANAQAFYLGVVGLLPVYKEAPGTGRIEIGFDKAAASPAQIKELVDMLKKEKGRWHSDRLGRRNGGAAGGMQNEALQKDVRARAVFHAVCELMESAV